MKVKMHNKIIIIVIVIILVSIIATLFLNKIGVEFGKAISGGIGFGLLLGVLAFRILSVVGIKKFNRKEKI